MRDEMIPVKKHQIWFLTEGRGIERELLMYFFSLSRFFLFSVFYLFMHNSVMAKDFEPNDTHSITCSIINLISNPQNYHNKKIFVVGVSVFDHEQSALYLSQEQVSIPMGGVWLSIPKNSKFSEKLIDYTYQYVLVEGIFDMTVQPDSLYGGVIKDITRLELWPVYRNPESAKDWLQFRKNQTQKAP
jgi:hypothetical protein